MARKYRVTSRTNTLGHSRGEIFTADLNKDLEARLIARGSLERVKRGEDTEEKKDAGDSQEQTSRDRN